MQRHGPVAAGFLLLLALVARPLWEGREQWNFGWFGDDGVYMVTAKAIAQGDGYRVLNLPNRPYAVQYPPLFPLYMSLSWLIQPRFPDTLRLAAILQALLIPIALATMLAMLRQLGLSWVRTFWVAGITLVTPPMVLMEVTLFAEPLFLCFFFAAILLIQRSAASDDSRAKWLALSAGLLTGLAYLTRSAALPMLGAAPLFYFLRKKPKLALWFLAVALPLSASWNLWTITHAGLVTQGNNATYVSEFVRFLRSADVWQHLWNQAGVISSSVAEILFPGFVGALMGLPLFYVVIAAAISGNIRMIRRSGWSVYVLFAIPYLVILMFWWFEGVARLILPIWPLMAAGIAEEVSHLLKLAGKNMKARGRGVLRWATVAVGFLVVVRTQAVAARQVHSLLADDRAQLLESMPAYAWLGQHTPENTVVLTWNDSITYLYSDAASSRSHFVELLPLPAENKAVALPLKTLPEMYEWGLLVLLKSDLAAGMWKDNSPFRAAAEALPESKLVFSTPAASIYNFKIVR